MKNKIKLKFTNYISFLHPFKKIVLFILRNVKKFRIYNKNVIFFLDVKV